MVKAKVGIGRQRVDPRQRKQFLEAVLGLTLLLGVFTRISLVCGALFMMALTIGVTSNQQWDVASQQLVYSVVFFLLLFLIEHNALALDNYLRRSSIQ